MRAIIGRSFLKLIGWSLVGGLPPTGKFVFIAAPHTSNWDLVLMIAASWSLKTRVLWLGKHTLFEGPFGWVIRAIGGLPVDRRKPQGLVAQAVELFERSDVLRLAVPVEGTRGRREHWRSGFYHIARGANVPVCTGFLDYGTRRAGLGELVELTGNVVADMDRIRAFYAPIKAKYPEMQSPVRLREEDAVEATADGPVPR
jgi:1-acyl-sn-glycerol-3-phosphate acyltransferase